MATAKDSGFNEAHVLSRIDYFKNLIAPYVYGTEGERSGYTYLTNGQTQFNQEVNTLITHVKNRHILIQNYLNSR